MRGALRGGTAARGGRAARAAQTGWVGLGWTAWSTGTGDSMITRHPAGEIPGGGFTRLIPSFGSRTAAAVMFGLFLLAVVSADGLHADALAGFGFAAGSAVAAGRTRRAELLLVVTSPPVIFLAALTCGDFLTMHMDRIDPTPGVVAANVLLTLSATAPWLFGGVAGAAVIASARGLGACVRDLRAELAGGGFAPSRHATGRPVPGLGPGGLPRPSRGPAELPRPSRGPAELPPPSREPATLSLISTLRYPKSDK